MLLGISNSIPQLTLLSLYNPPATFSGIKTLSQWLQTEATLQTPRLLMMDSNLHHPLWNPSKYNNTHTQERDLIKIFGRPAAIDLTWANHKTQSLRPVAQVQLNNHSSDHCPIITRLTLPSPETHTSEKHLSVQLKDLENTPFLPDLQQNLPKETTTASLIETTTQEISTAITFAYNDQRRWVTANPARSKAWWNKEQLGGLVRLRDQASRKMLKHQTNKSREEYYHYQNLLKKNVWELKSNHWRKFLAEKGPNHAYQAYKLTKNKQEEEITSLQNQEASIISDITEKSSLLFYGTSIVETTANLKDIPHQQPPDSPPITRDEVANAISTLPNRKAPGPDGIPNKLIKLSTAHGTPILTDLYNCFLRPGEYPNSNH
ncbi:hypothetical protein O181_091498 [Austropuccinia psidii MF-1]|uniref:Endonuclease/exonuclease/phosphatase domain-containing protein n=1 Tax=Austropuccinia psidii MF-1 TaxID=1389203 RepID=A0A9Q3IWW2_9BASI|nr:hypothetical protein [Austropuccinia psidii MF-1]